MSFCRSFYDNKMINFSYLSRSLIELELEPVCSEYNIKRLELFLLLILEFNPRINSAKKICDLGELKRSNVSIMVESLCNRGIIVQEIDKDDRRSYKLSLTEKAKPIIEKSINIIDKVYTSILEGIPEDELKRGEKLFGKMYENLKKINSKLNLEEIDAK